MEELHSKVGSFLRILNQTDVVSYGIELVDWSKILVNTRLLNQSAPDCVKYLRENHGIEPELWDEENILFVIGIGNTPEDIKELTKSLHSLANSPLGKRSIDLKPRDEVLTRYYYPQLVQRMTPRAAFFARRRQISLQESSGCVAAETISPYPPGIPLVIMGEEITSEIVDLLVRGRAHWQGWDGVESGMIWVVEEN